MNTKEWMQALGPLRLVLMAGAAVLVLLLPWPGVEAGPVRTVVVPALGPIVFFVLLLDALMSRVNMIEADDRARARYRRCIQADLAAAGVLLLAWLPYFLSRTL